MRGHANALLGLAFCLAALANSAPASASPVFLSSFGSFSNPQALTVDQSSGDVYVVDVQGSFSVKRFDASGTPDPFSASQPYISGNALTGTSNGPFTFAPAGSLTQVAVDNSGNPLTNGDIYVAESVRAGEGHNQIDIFDPSGNYLGNINQDPVGLFLTSCGVAVDQSNGDLYLSDEAGRIDRYVPTTSPPTNADYNAQITGLSKPCNLAVNSSGSVYASSVPSGPLTRFLPADFGTSAPTGTQIDAVSRAVAIDPSSDDVYADEGSQIAQFDSSNGLLGTFGSGHITGSEGVAVNGSTETLYATNTGGDRSIAVFGPPGTLLPPTVSESGASAVTTTAAKLTARVNPQNQATTYHFEYGSADCATSVCKRAPAVDAGIPAEAGDVHVSQAITGLQPDTTYHFRIVATNASDTTDGPDHTFTTYPITPPQTCVNAAMRTGPSADLPDCRAYEQVTPTDKEYGFGTETGNLGRATSSPSGDAVIYQAAGPLPGALSAPFGDNFYLGSRTESGWGSNPVSPPQAPVAGSGVFPIFAAFSPDLSKAVVVSKNPPLAADAVPDTQNLYLETNPAASYRLLTPAGVNHEGGIAFAGASADFSHIAFTSDEPQTSEAPPSQNQVYEWVGGQLRLVGILPEGTVAPSATAAAPGFGGVVSADGSRIFFASGGELYMREDAITTIPVSASQRVTPDPNGTRRAEFWRASTDGSRVFFTSSAELTESANTGRNSSDEPTDEGNDLYEYDRDSGVLTDLTVDENEADSLAGADVQGVAGISEDGSRIYFVADGDLAEGAVSGQPNLYLYRGGTLTFIATLDASADETDWAAEQRLLTSQVTPDGANLAFTSVRRLTGSDNTDAASGEADEQVFLYRADKDRLECASCNPSGVLPLGPSGFSTSARHVPPSLTRNLSVDGRRVFFDSKDALVPSDTDGHQDVYMYEEGRIALLSSGLGRSDSAFIDASASGNDVFFASTDELVPSDHDELADLYDARVDGGYRAEIPSPPCVGDACRGPVIAPPEQANPASSGLFGSGNVKRQHHRTRHRKRRHRRRRRRASAPIHRALGRTGGPRR